MSQKSRVNGATPSKSSSLPLTTEPVTGTIFLLFLAMARFHFGSAEERALAVEANERVPLEGVDNDDADDDDADDADDDGADDAADDDADDANDNDADDADEDDDADDGRPDVAEVGAKTPAVDADDAVDNTVEDAEVTADVVNDAEAVVEGADISDGAGYVADAEGADGAVTGVEPE